MGDQHIFLVGFSGCGKSTTGPMLARALKRRFVDTDQLIEARAQKSTGEIFSLRGEPYFRKLESAVLREWASTDVPAVIAVGGGAVVREANRAVMARVGMTVYLRCSQRELYHRLMGQLDRPLLTGATVLKSAEKKERIRRLLSDRRSFYEQADLIVSVTNLSPHQAAVCILRKLKEKAWLP